MPTITRFYGITIRMYFLSGEHNPPHIHAIYGEHAAAINFMTDEIIEGTLPNKAIKLVLEWIGLHRSELKEMWESQNFTEIAPLD